MGIPRTRTELENYLVYGVDPTNRRIFFGHPLDWGELSEDLDNNEIAVVSIELTIRAIKRMEKDHPSKPIELYMHSYGGNPDHMIYLMDTILASKCQFKFFGGGVIQSSATWIMAICDERYLYPSARVMFHHGSESFKGNYIDFEIYYEDAKNYKDFLVNVYSENSHMPKQFWDDVCQRDLSINANEAILLGLAEEIVPQPKRGNLRKKRHAKMKNMASKRTMTGLVKKLYKRVKINLPNKELKLHIPTPDPADPNVVVDNTPVPKDEYNNEYQKEEKNQEKENKE